MKLFKATIFLLTLSLAVPAFAEESEEAKLDAQINNGDLVLIDEDGTVTKFITPQTLLDGARFEVRIKREVAEEEVEDSPEELALPEPSLADRIEARRIMHEANQAFFKGEVARTWELVGAAEALDPDFYRIKTMKGSLLYKIGSKELALEVWQESLAQNPDQPEIIQVFKRLKIKPKDRAKIAKGTLTNPRKKASVQ